MSEIFELLILAVLLTQGDKWSGAIGGAVYHLFTVLLSAIPRFGKMYRRVIIEGPIKFTALFKIPSWAISSSGVVLGLIIHNWIWGQPNHPIEFWVILIIAFTAILKILHDVILFQLTGYEEIVEFMKEVPILVKPLERQLPGFEKLLRNQKVRLSLSRAHFVDTNITPFFRLLVSLGVCFFCLAHLQLINTTTIPTLLEAETVAFSLLINAIDENKIPFSGQVWNIIYITSKAIVLFWLVIFLALASSTVDQVVDDAENTILTNQIDPNDFETRYQSGSKAKSTVKIIAALLNPIGDEIGAESVTIINTSSQYINLNGWTIMDKNGGIESIPDCILPAGSTLRLSLGNNLRLSNRGGNISLLNPNNQVIDTVNYSENDASTEGITVIF